MGSITSSTPIEPAPLDPQRPTACRRRPPLQQAAETEAVTDARCNSVVEHFRNGQADLRGNPFRVRWNQHHESYLWLLVSSCVKKIGQPLDYSELIQDPKMRLGAWKFVQELITCGAFRLAGVEIELGGQWPVFTAVTAEMARAA